MVYKVPQDLTRSLLSLTLSVSTPPVTFCPSPAVIFQFPDGIHYSPAPRPLHMLLLLPGMLLGLSYHLVNSHSPSVLIPCFAGKPYQILLNCVSMEPSGGLLCTLVQVIHVKNCSQLR